MNNPGQDESSRQSYIIPFFRFESAPKRAKDLQLDAEMGEAKMGKYSSA